MIFYILFFWIEYDGIIPMLWIFLYYEYLSVQAFLLVDINKVSVTESL